MATYNQATGVIELSGQIPRPVNFARLQQALGRGVYIGSVNVSAATHFIGQAGHPISLASSMRDLDLIDGERLASALENRGRFMTEGAR